MASLVPRMHLFEIDDQTWFPSFLRSRVQGALTLAWTSKTPILADDSPARIVASLLQNHVPALTNWVMIDFCAGGGGPTPTIERLVNRSLAQTSNGVVSPVKFVLTDLHPHPEMWAAAAARSPNLTYEERGVDASAADPQLIERHARQPGGKRKKVFRLFNLAFHHFDDPLAKAILKNTLETGDGFGIFELQDRSFVSFITCCLLGIGAMLNGAYIAWLWRSPATFIFTYLVPILPFVLVFDGWVSSLRSRTPDEVEALLRTCGGPNPHEWELKSGKIRHLWPCGYVHWIICAKKSS